MNPRRLPRDPASATPCGPRPGRGSRSCSPVARGPEGARPRRRAPSVTWTSPRTTTSSCSRGTPRTRPTARSSGPDATLPDGFPGVGDFNKDGKPDAVLVGSGEVWISTGATGVIELGPVTLPGTGSGGAPTVADFDGDGFPEIGVAQENKYTVLKPDYAKGTIDVVWSMDIPWQAVRQMLCSSAKSHPESALPPRIAGLLTGLVGCEAAGPELQRPAARSAVLRAPRRPAWHGLAARPSLAGTGRRPSSPPPNSKGRRCGAGETRQGCANPRVCVRNAPRVPFPRTDHSPPERPRTGSA